MNISILEAFKKRVLNTTNNYPLCHISNTCTDDDNSVDPEDGPVDNETPLPIRMYSVTFETLYKNLASYPNHIEASNRKYVTRTYYLENDKVITIVNDLRTPKTIVTTISGDTGFPIDLVRTIVINPDKSIDTVYNR